MMLRKRINDPKIQYLMVLFANAITILLAFVINVVITHTMKTESYGFYRAFVNSTTMLTTLTGFGFSLTLSKDFAVCKESKEKKQLTAGALLINLAISLGAFLVLLAISPFTSFLGFEIPYYLLLAAAFVWTLLFNQFYLFRFQGENNMVSYSLLTAIPQVLLFFSYVLCYLMGWLVSAFAAIAFYLVGHLLIIAVFVVLDLPSFRNIRSTIKDLLRRNREYGFQLYLGSIFSVASAQILNLLVATLAGLGEYALFTMGMSIATPIAQIPAVMGTISFKKNVDLKRIPSKQMIVTFAMTAIAFVAYALFLKFLFPLLLGEQYRNCTSYGIVMMFYYSFIGLGDFFNRFIMAKGQGKMIRNSSFVVGGVLIISASVLIPFFKIKGVIFAEILSGIAYFFMMITRYFKTIKLTTK